MKKRRLFITTIQTLFVTCLIVASGAAARAQDLGFLEEPGEAQPADEPEDDPLGFGGVPGDEGDTPAAQPDDETREHKLTDEMEIPEEYGAAEVIAAYREGKELFDNEEYAEAIDHFSYALAIDPRFLPGYFDRGRAFAKLKYYDLALKSLSKAVVYGRQFPKVYNERGMVYLEKEEFQDAVDDFLDAVELRPTKAEYLYNLGRAYIKLGSEGRSIGSAKALENYETGINFLDRAIEAEEAENITEHRSKIYFERGFGQAEIGRGEKAVEDLEQAVQFDNSNGEYLERLGYAYLQQGDAENLAKAIGAFSAIMRIEPPAEDEKDEDTKFPEIRTILVARAVAFINLATDPEGKAGREANLKAAVRDCEATLAMESRQPIAFLNRGIALRFLGQDDKALESYSEALRMSPGYAEAHFRRGLMWFHAKEYELAMEDFRDGSDSDPRPLFWIGLIHSEQGDYDQAIESYTKAIRLNQGYVMAYRNRALAFMRIGQYERAVRDLNGLIRRDGKDAKSYYQRGIAYERLGNRTQAVDSYEKAVRWDPALAAAKTRLDALQ